jgi:glycosyltransferase involved in cell wall biosynthesis
MVVHKEDLTYKGIMEEVFNGKTVVCFTNDLWSSPLTELRVKAPLEECGFHVVQGNAFDKLMVNDLSKADFVVIQRDFPLYIDKFFYVLNQVRINKIPLVYDIDDNLFELPANHKDHDHYSGRYAPVLWAIWNADMVTTSTEPLAEFLLPFNKNIHVLKNCLVDKYWQFSPVKSGHSENDAVVIGYVGGTTHEVDLNMIVSALKFIGQQHGSKVQFKFWGAHPPQEMLNHPYVKWQPVVVDYQEYAVAFQSQDIDILIAPLADSPFARSKSHIKFLEYSTLGVPGVYSNVTPYQQVVTHGENGFLATSSEEWIGCLQNLISSPNLRSHLAYHAQQTVKRDWLLSKNADHWLSLYNELYVVGSKNYGDTNKSLAAIDSALCNILSIQSTQIEKLLNNKKSLMEMEQLVQSLSAQLTEKGYQLVDKDAQLSAIYHSFAWRMIQPLRRLLELSRGTWFERLWFLIRNKTS